MAHTWRLKRIPAVVDHSPVIETLPYVEDSTAGAKAGAFAAGWAGLRKRNSPPGAASGSGRPNNSRRDEQVIATTDRAALDASEGERARMHRAFTQATRLEWQFWDSAYRDAAWTL